MSRSLEIGAAAKARRVIPERGGLSAIVDAPPRFFSVLTPSTRTWFTRPGRRVLAIVPDPIVHDTLRLDIDPKATSLVRVFVARVEYETPADQRALVDAVLSGDDKTLAARGRFLEPELRVALRDEHDPERAAALRRALHRLVRETD